MAHRRYLPDRALTAAERKRLYRQRHPDKVADDRAADRVRRRAAHLAAGEIAAERPRLNCSECDWSATTRRGDQLPWKLLHQHRRAEHPEHAAAVDQWARQTSPEMISDPVEGGPNIRMLPGGILLQ